MSGHRPTQILLVEDNDDDAFLFKRSIRRLGNIAEVHRFTDADEAMAALGSLSPSDLPSLVLLDIKLWGMDGLEVLAWIRSHPSLRELKVVMFSSSDLDSDRSEALKRKADGYFVKPLSAPEYDVVVSQIISRHLNQESASG
jgi:CheY-like chemotaxis protein